MANHVKTHISMKRVLILMLAAAILLALLILLWPVEKVQAWSCSEFKRWSESEYYFRCYDQPCNGGTYNYVMERQWEEQCLNCPSQWGGLQCYRTGRVRVRVDGTYCIPACLNN